MKHFAPIVAILLALGLAVAFAASRPAQAQEQPQEQQQAQQTPADPIPASDAVTALTGTVGTAPGGAPDQACRLCHVGKTGTLTLPSGEELPLGVDPAVLDTSVHGSHAAASVYCTDCHTDRQRYQYPHEPTPAQNLAEYRADVAANCERCHTSAELHNPGHLQALQQGKVPAADLPNCVDCHGGHDVETAEAMYAAPIAFCRTCHQTFEDPELGRIHNEVVASLDSPEHNCTTCHSDTVQSTDQQCKNCHSLLTSWINLPNGDVVDPHVTPAHIESSVHGYREIDGMQYTPLQCTDCHRDEGHQQFPHPALDVNSRRELTVQMESVCQECHQDIFQQTRDGIHHQAIAEGKEDAATCADCHGSHNIQPPDVPRERVSETCGNCHDEINEQYRMSVHGAALLGEDNPDVPVCTDCHGAHGIEAATTSQFRLNSPNICAKCHANHEIMDKYEISTDVMDTYVADFHGTTNVLFARETTEQKINTAVCTDCHGVHNILPATDENSSIMRANLLTTCQQCHPDATDNFSAAWMSHYKPSIEHNPLVYFVNLFYRIVIPLTVGAFVLFIASDVYRRLWNRLRRKQED